LLHGDRSIVPRACLWQTLRENTRRPPAPLIGRHTRNRLVRVLEFGRGLSGQIDGEHWRNQATSMIPPRCCRADGTHM
jgi:hypothetical protein